MDSRQFRQLKRTIAGAAFFMGGAVCGGANPDHFGPIVLVDGAFALLGTLILGAPF